MINKTKQLWAKHQQIGSLQTVGLADNYQYWSTHFATTAKNITDSQTFLTQLTIEKPWEAWALFLRKLVQFIWFRLN